MKSLERNRTVFMDQINPFTNQIFQHAVLQGDMAIVSVMLKYGVSVRRGESNHQGLTALQQSVLDGNIRMAIRLLEYGSDIEAKTANGWNSLHIASATGDLNMVRMLLSHCADIVSLTKNEELPIDLATSTEIKLFLSQEMSKAGYVELANWYMNKISTQDNNGSPTMSPDSLIEIACDSPDSLGSDMCGYCNLLLYSYSPPINMQHSSGSESNIATLSKSNGKGSKNSSTWSLSPHGGGTYVNSTPAEMCHPYACAMPPCSSCAQMYIGDYESNWAMSNDMFYMSTSSGYVSEVAPERPPSEPCGHHQIKYERDSYRMGHAMQPCCMQAERLGYLKHSTSTPSITALHIGEDDTSKVNERSYSLSLNRRKNSVHSTKEIKQMNEWASDMECNKQDTHRFEINIDYYRDSIDQSGDVEEYEEDTSADILNTDLIKRRSESDVSRDSLDSDQVDTEGDQVDTGGNQVDIEGDQVDTEDGRKCDAAKNSEEMLECVQNTMDSTDMFKANTSDLHLSGPKDSLHHPTSKRYSADDAGNMYFNPMYKSSDTSSGELQDKAGKKYRHPDNVSLDWQGIESYKDNGKESGMQENSSIDRKKRKKGIFYEIVSKFKETVKVTRSSSDTDLTNTDEETAVVKRDTRKIKTLRRRRHVRRSNSFSSYFPPAINQTTTKSEDGSDINVNNNGDCNTSRNNAALNPQHRNNESSNQYNVKDPSRFQYDHTDQMPLQGNSTRQYRYQHEENCQMPVQHNSSNRQFTHQYGVTTQSPVQYETTTPTDNLYESDSLENVGTGTPYSPHRSMKHQGVYQTETDERSRRQLEQALFVLEQQRAMFETEESRYGIYSRDSGLGGEARDFGFDGDYQEDYQELPRPRVHSPFPMSSTEFFLRDSQIYSWNREETMGQSQRSVNTFPRASYRQSNTGMNSSIPVSRNKSSCMSLKMLCK